ncbi:transport between ER and Golgi ATPase protein [Pseudogymnoascus verrucosus]|uniref:Transport between ER and Golgi ATPase protein n=1 Tax=Pseudogymnoascus verrucosus TaxID=342668 RepID=A0A1B8GKB5_9PEZI|nr:transport between ER and Golgi ATPase protein [Pseudogymnoascus verrucosus]OBT96282.1 transport between ER and Golgi ATPase protein [Pseudogymnoascus verrucosus]
MASVLLESADAKNSFVDLSGVDSSAFSNPYDALIEACNDDPALLQQKYSNHRQTRNAQQKANLLSPTFPGLILDGILLRRVDPTISPGYIDPRNSLVFWGRPPPHVRTLAATIQAKLKEISPRIWLMPPENMHITLLEITHSRPPSAIPPLIKALSPVIPTIISAPTKSPSRLIKPLVSFDAAAVALSFVPVADEKYSYHHLRRDLFALTAGTGVEVGSRYVVPSAHATLGRFIYAEDHDSTEKMERWVEGIEKINQWLEETYWGEGGLEWVVDQELVLREGRLWYGGGETVAGEGVEWKGVYEKEVESI